MTPYRAILGVIALERFAWYCFVGMLALWKSSAAVGTLLFWAYLSPMLGGLLGRYSLRASVVGGASLLCAGYVAATLNRDPLPLLALGCGLFKPCLSALLGSLFPVGAARTAAFGRYYAAIQVGSMPSTLVGGYLHYRYGWNAAFAVCACALGLCLLLLAFSWAKLAARESIADMVIDTITQPQWGRLAVLCVGAIVFFAGFQQQQTTLVLWARDVCRMKLPEAVSTLNPVFAVAFLASPLAAWRDLRGRLTLGMLFLAAGFGVLLLGSSLQYLALWYLLATAGEVLISPLGLDLAGSLVPRRLSAIATALFLSAMSLGGWLAGQLGSLSDLRQAVALSAALALAGALWFHILVAKPATHIELRGVLCPL